MKNKYLFVTVLLLILAFLGYGFTRLYTGMEEQKGGEELLIVTSFYPIYVATLNVAGDCEGVRVENLSEPQTGCLHDYQMTPQDMILLSEADVFVVNGGGIEGFLSDVAAEYPDLLIVDAGAKIFGEDVQEEEHQHQESHDGHNHGENAHVWMSISHYMEQIEAIRDGLAEADAAHREEYDHAAEEYLNKIAKLQQKAEEVKQLADDESIVIFHEAFAFVAEDYGMHVVGEMNLDEERQVSAGEVADIISTIEEHDVKIVLAEALYGKDMGDTIEEETDCTVYYLDTLVRGEENEEGWLLGMEQNIDLLKEAMETIHP